MSGLSAWLGEQLEVFSDVDKWGMLFILCYLTAAMTEVTSNTAISILLLPILSSLVSRCLTVWSVAVSLVSRCLTVW